jgi:hypothetical protein
MDRVRKLGSRSTVMPWCLRDARLGIMKRLQVIERRARVVPLHVRHKREIETTIPKHRDRDVDFGVVEALKNVFQMGHRDNDRTSARKSSRGVKRLGADRQAHWCEQQVQTFSLPTRGLFAGLCCVSRHSSLGDSLFGTSVLVRLARVAVWSTAALGATALHLTRSMCIMREARIILRRRTLRL